MRSVVFAIGFSLFALPAHAQQFNVVCEKATDSRIIEVLTPGTVGRACDVKYTRDGGANVKTPYHANGSKQFCFDRAQEMALNLTNSGFVCSDNAETVVEAAPNADELNATQQVAVAEIEPVLQSTAPTTPEPTQTIVAEAQPEPAAAVEQAAEQEQTLATSAEEAAPAEIQTVAAASEPDAADPVDGDVLAEKMNEILAQPSIAQKKAVRGPEPLAVAEPEPLPARQAAPAGRIAGASPEVVAPSRVAAIEKAKNEIAPKPAAETIQEPAAEIAAKPAVKIANENSATPAQSVTLASTSATGNSKGALRDPKDIITAILRSRVAAWNEGNLQAFMNVYWKDDGLKFVKNGRVSKGWSSAMKRYREQYESQEGLGRLSIEKPDINLVTDDVAVVTGRFTHFSKSENSTPGMFSLVLHRNEGVWRIVHDHSVDDPVATQ
ncbi:MAG: nuclear transport factor 2 family protein [Marinicaulis sp.]|nr:nuclear transport factor 2 family protein [Marinicaulis sp.]